MLPLKRNCGPDYQAPNWTSVFGNDAPLEVDLGCGRGHFVLERARRCKTTNFIGLDTKRKWIEIINQQADEAQLANMRAIRVDARQDLPLLFSQSSVRGFTVFHPDPWWKKRHRKRRLIQADTVDLLARLLVPNGWIFCQTDVPDLAAEMKRVIAQHPQFKEQNVERFIGAHFDGVMSHRAQKCETLGIPIQRTVYQKVCTT